MPLISIIIPVYNLETRIRGTLECVLGQDYENFEIIIVDDASNDGTLNIVNETLKETKKRYQIIQHKTNFGVSTARNSGMKSANGKFILFWDGDDLADSNFISTLYETIESKEDNCNIAFCGYRTREEKTGEEKKHPISVASGVPPQQIAALRILSKIKLNLCSAIYRNAYLKSIDLKFFDGCTAGEDIEFVIKALIRCGHLNFSQACNYIYIQHDEMGNRKNADTREKKLKRYIHNTEAHARTESYLHIYAIDEILKYTAKKFLIPQTILRRLSICAALNDSDNFDKIRMDRTTRDLLWGNHKFCFKKSDVFFKALVLLLIPNVFFRYYQKYF